MVEGAAVQSQTQSQNQHHSLEDEAIKRNTDCVYFLASPLTCKKGDECEYRHSDVARLNPRDCWFWLHSNCLNPKCAFRHPPLDGLLGNQVPSSAGSSSASKRNPVAAATSHAPNSAAKQGVPCVFFQKGHCLKGHWCPFLHIPNSSSSSSKGLPVKGASSSAEPQIVEPALSNFQTSVPDKKVLAPPAAQPIKSIPQERATAVNQESASFSNEFAAKSRTHLSMRVDDHIHGFRSSNGNLLGVVNPYESESLNRKSLEEVSREPSPGFDVLVDDERRDSDYYPGEDGPTNEYDIGHSTDYDIIAAIGNERYQESLGYDVHDHQYSWEQRISGGSSGGSYYEKRPYGRPEIDESDLRNQLMKHKKPNGLRSVIRHDLEIGDEGYEGNPVSSRLRGRIRLPGRSTPPRSNRDHDHGTMMMQERIMSSEPFTNGYSMNVDFEGPKSLAELKNRKERESSFRKRRREEEPRQQDPWFEGPKSLEEILKRKRGASGGGVDVNGNGDEGLKKDGEDELFEYAGGEEVEVEVEVEEEEEEEGGGGGEGEEEEEEYDDEEFAKKMGVVAE